MKDYAKLRELLVAQESFPLFFTLKFIGKNSDRFSQGVREFEGRYPSMRQTQSRPSKGGTHLALTYVFLAKNADEIIEVFQASAAIEDVMVVL